MIAQRLYFYRSIPNNPVIFVVPNLQASQSNQAVAGRQNQIGLVCSQKSRPPYRMH